MFFNKVNLHNALRVVYRVSTTDIDGIETYTFFFRECPESPRFIKCYVPVVYVRTLGSDMKSYSNGFQLLFSGIHEQIYRFTEFNAELFTQRPFTPFIGNSDSHIHPASRSEPRKFLHLFTGVKGKMFHSISSGHFQKFVRFDRVA